MYNLVGKQAIQPRARHEAERCVDLYPVSTAPHLQLRILHLSPAPTQPCSLCDMETVNKGYLDNEALGCFGAILINGHREIYNRALALSPFEYGIDSI